jgi:transcriptional regulator with XRE-family HTH domain
MARERTEPLTEAARRHIRVAMASEGINQSELALRVGVNRSTISRILRGQGAVTLVTLMGLAGALRLALETLSVQYELNFEITDEFEALAQQALRHEIRRLQAEMPKVSALSVTGTVALRFHGVGQEERVFERAFPIRVPRRTKKRKTA